MISSATYLSGPPHQSGSIQENQIFSTKDVKAQCKLGVDMLVHAHSRCSTLKGAVFKVTLILVMSISELQIELD